MTITPQIEQNLNAAMSLAYGVRVGAALTDWERNFLDDLGGRYERFGAKTYISDKQAAIIARIAAKAR